MRKKDVGSRSLAASRSTHGSDNLLHRRLAARHPNETSDDHGRMTSVFPAIAQLPTHVRVLGLQSYSVVLHVVEYPNHVSTEASVVAVAPRTVDDFLLREFGQLARLLTVMGLRAANGRERIAGAAHVLVFDSSDDSLLTPVDAVWDGRIGHGQRSGGQTFEERLVRFCVRDLAASGNTPQFGFRLRKKR